MRVVLYLSTNEREQALSRAFTKGLYKHNVTVIPMLRADFWQKSIEREADIVGFVGVKSRELWQATVEAGKIPLIIDKGYFGRDKYYRISIGSYQPSYLSKIPFNLDRLKKAGVELKPFKNERGRHVMFCASSDKYNQFHNLPAAEEYAYQVCSRMLEVAGDLPVVYRPKPSWYAKHGTKTVPPPGAKVSLTEQFSDLLKDCHLVVTHGSNGAIEALAAGVPIIALGGPDVSPVWHLGGRELTAEWFDMPFIPQVEQRDLTLAQLAYCQFSMEEFSNGTFWEMTRKWCGV